jgi:hypothetical protein
MIALFFSHSCHSVMMSPDGSLWNKRSLLACYSRRNGWLTSMVHVECSQEPQMSDMGLKLFFGASLSDLGTLMDGTHEILI